MQSTLSAAFAVLAWLLAGVGLYGVMSLSVRRRRREMGLRLALGAAPRRLLRFVLGRALLLVLGGLLAGLLAAGGVARLLAGQLYGVSPSDPTVYLGTAGLLLLLGLAAALTPALRAAWIDPLETLREE